MSAVHDLVGVGLGPANLGLAALSAPLGDLDAVFLERESEFSWHPGMLLEQATLQTPFLGDLVTMADPTSPYSFLNYLKAVGRLYPFYIRGSMYPLRAEFDDYCRWTAGRLGSVRFGHDVERVERDEDTGGYVVTAGTPDGPRRVRGRRLALGVGSRPYVPPPLRAADGSPVPGAVHSAEYLPRRDELRARDRVVVVGSGQSAAEIVQDLLSDPDPHGRELVWVTRSPRFFPLEYTKLTLEMTSPEYSDYFHDLPAGTRDELLASQRGLYKGISGETVDAIFDLLYARGRTGAPPVRLLTNTAVVGVSGDGPRHRLRLEHVEQGRGFELDTDGLVLATGYRPADPAFLEPLGDGIARDGRGRYAVRRDYTVEQPATPGAEIFVQNAEEHTHGFVAPDLGMTAYRNSWLLRSITGREVYPVERAIAFQEFGAPEGSWPVPETAEGSAA